MPPAPGSYLGFCIASVARAPYCAISKRAMPPIKTIVLEVPDVPRAPHVTHEMSGTAWLAERVLISALIFGLLYVLRKCWSAVRARQRMALSDALYDAKFKFETGIRRDM